MVRVAGIDGGGTKTVCAVCNEQGVLLGMARAGSSKLQDVGEATTQDTLTLSVEKALGEASLSIDQLDALCVGAAGMDTDADERLFQAIVSRIVPASLPVRIENDGLVGLYSGTFGKPGIAIVAGTGMLVVGLDGRGRTGRVGGWGYLFNDEGSAFYIGHEALLAALRDYDGRGARTRLTEAIVNDMNIRNIGEMPAVFYALESPETAMAELAPTVTKVAEAGDPPAAQILKQAGRHLALAAKAQINQLEFDQRQHIDVVLIGSVFHSSMVRISAQAEIRSAYPNAKFIRPSWEPVVGALVLALDQAGIQFNKQAGEQLQQQFKVKGVA